APPRRISALPHVAVSGPLGDCRRRVDVHLFDIRLELYPFWNAHTPRGRTGLVALVAPREPVECVVHALSVPRRDSSGPSFNDFVPARLLPVSCRRGCRSRSRARKGPWCARPEMTGEFRTPDDKFLWNSASGVMFSTSASLTDIASRSFSFQNS